MGERIRFEHGHDFTTLVNEHSASPFGLVDSQTCCHSLSYLLETVVDTNSGS